MGLKPDLGYIFIILGDLFPFYSIIRENCWGFEKMSHQKYFDDRSDPSDRNRVGTQAKKIKKKKKLW